MLRKRLIYFLLLMSFSELSTARNFLVVAHDFPPLQFRDGEDVKGGMIEIMKEICKRAKSICKFEIVALARVFKLMEENGADAFVSVIKLPERETQSHFSEPLVLLNLSYVGLERSKIPKMKDLNQLLGWNVVATRGGVSSRMAQKHKEQVQELTIIEDVDSLTMIRNLNGDKYGPKTMLLGSEEVLTSVANSQGVKLDTIHKVEQLKMTIAFSKKRVSAEDARKLDQIIKSMKKDGTMKKILARYKLQSA